MLYCIVYKMSNVLNVFSLSVCSLYVCALSYFKEALLNCYNKYNIAIATTSLLRNDICSCIAPTTNQRTWCFTEYCGLTWYLQKREKKKYAWQHLAKSVILLCWLNVEHSVHVFHEHKLFNMFLQEDPVLSLIFSVHVSQETWSCSAAGISPVQRGRCSRGC